MPDTHLSEIKKSILNDNREKADMIRNRNRERGVFLVNIMSSPGSGKTSLILGAVEMLKQKYRIAVLETDIASSADSEIIAKEGVEVIQVRTGGAGCLDAEMVQQGLDAVQTEDVQMILMENVGNLVSPAEYDTGADRNVLILSVPEGDDKPLKFPLMFSVCDVLIINKMDYMLFSDFDITRVIERVHKLNPGMAIIEVSCRTGAGIERWIRWLEKEMKEVLPAEKP